MKFSSVLYATLAAQIATAAPLYVTYYTTNYVTVTVGANGNQIGTTTTQAADNTGATTTTVAAAAATTSTSAPAATSDAATTSSSSSSGSSDSSLSSFASTMLNAHNEKRAAHGSPDLTWDDSLAAYAQAYADKYDCSGTLTHSGGPHGENLALGYTPEKAVDAWYSEGDNYDYGSCSSYDHFTQVIWKSTTKLGCGQKSCGGYWGDYIICSYDPAGNMVGECAQNVFA